MQFKKRNKKTTDIGFVVTSTAGPDSGGFQNQEA
jgi:hypothetical protein